MLYDLNRKKNNSYIFVSLHTHLLPFTEGQIRLGDSLLSQGVQPVFVKVADCTCSLPLSFLEKKAEPAAKCQKCRSDEKLLKETLCGWKVYSLSKFFRHEDLSDVDKCLALVDWQDVAAFSFRGIDVGKAALHDVALKFKIEDTVFQRGTDVQKECEAILRGSMLSQIRFERLLIAMQTAAVVVYNSNYSINRTIAMLCESSETPVYSMCGGNSLRRTWDTLILTKGSSMDVYRTACDTNWSNGMSLRVMDRKETDAVYEHFEELLDGKKAHAYSAPSGSASPASLVPPEGKRGKQKPVLLFCLSSPDEYVSGMKSGICPDPPREQYLFPTQEEMIHFVIAKAAEDPDLHLIIRPHPREFPNKRESRMSANAYRLKRILQNLPNNVVVNWPDQLISFYDLLQHVDMVIAAGSTTLLEASLFGCPIVLPYSPLRYYDACADAVCSDRATYWQKVLEFSEKEWSIQRSINSFRWYWMLLVGSHLCMAGAGARKATFRERLMKAIGYASEKAFRGNPPYPTITSAFSGGFKELIYRPIDPVGAATAFAVLNGRIDPMADFERLQRAQGGRRSDTNPCQAAEEEEKAVLEQLSHLARVLNVREDTFPKSKFLRLLRNNGIQA